MDQPDFTALVCDQNLDLSFNALRLVNLMLEARARRLPEPFQSTPSQMQIQARTPARSQSHHPKADSPVVPRQLFTP
jgi:hypothetical protein